VQKYYYFRYKLESINYGFTSFPFSAFLDLSPGGPHQLFKPGAVSAHTSTSFAKKAGAEV
jgi:hypothetical protein